MDSPELSNNNSFKNRSELDRLHLPHTLHASLLPPSLPILLRPRLAPLHPRPLAPALSLARRIFKRNPAALAHRPLSRQSSLNSVSWSVASGLPQRSLETPPSGPAAFEAGEILRLCHAPRQQRSNCKGRSRGSSSLASFSSLATTTAMADSVTNADANSAVAAAAASSLAFPSQGFVPIAMPRSVSDGASLDELIGFEEAESAPRVVIC